MKLFSALALGFSLLMSATAVHANLYKEGTKFHGYVAALDDFIPESVEVLFIDVTDREGSILALNPNAFEGDHALQAMVTDAFDVKKDPNNVIYADMLLAKKYNTNKDICYIITDRPDVFESSYMHEIMHCIARSTAERYDFAKAISPALSKDFQRDGTTKLTSAIKTNNLLELHAHIYADVIMQRTGLKGDELGQKIRKELEYPRSVGKLSTQRGIELCRIKSCSTDASDLMKELMDDAKFREALKEDFKTVSAYLDRTGHWE